MSIPMVGVSTVGVALTCLRVYPPPLTKMLRGKGIMPSEGNPHGVHAGDITDLSEDQMVGNHFGHGLQPPWWRPAR